MSDLHRQTDKHTHLNWCYLLGVFVIAYQKYQRRLAGMIWWKARQDVLSQENPPRWQEAAHIANDFCSNFQRSSTDKQATMMRDKDVEQEHVDRFRALARRRNLLLHGDYSNANPDRSPFSSYSFDAFGNVTGTLASQRSEPEQVTLDTLQDAIQEAQALDDLAWQTNVAMWRQSRQSKGD